MNLCTYLIENKRYWSQRPTLGDVSPVRATHRLRMPRPFEILHRLMREPGWWAWKRKGTTKGVTRTFAGRPMGTTRTPVRFRTWPPATYSIRHVYNSKVKIHIKSDKGKKVNYRFNKTAKLSLPLQYLHSARLRIPEWRKPLLQHILTSMSWKCLSKQHPSEMKKAIVLSISFFQWNEVLQ